MRIHFVYAGDCHNDLKHAPFTITRNVYNALKSLGDVVYYDWCHSGPFQQVDDGDIIIGHPNYPESTATRQLFSKNARAKILIFPLHHGMPEINFPFNDLVEKADAVLSITGRYWYDTIQNTKFAHWKNKITRLDMAINADEFPLIKKSFNPKGNRSFFYIGADRPEKGLSTLHSIFSGTSHQLHLYGSVDGNSAIARLPNVHLHGWATMDSDFAKSLAGMADFYVHGGVSDANPTTLLESACWGFNVACTPQSGYWPDDPFYGLNSTDIAGCRGLLDYLQEVPENVLLIRAMQVREVMVRDYNWDLFTDKVVEVVKRFI